MAYKVRLKDPFAVNSRQTKLVAPRFAAVDTGAGVCGISDTLHVCWEFKLLCAVLGLITWNILAEPSMQG